MARNFGRALPGVGVTGLCAAVAAALVVPAVLAPPSRQQRPLPVRPHAAPHMAPVSTSSSTLPAACTTSGNTVTCHWTTAATVSSPKTGSVTIPAGVTTAHLQLNGSIGGGTHSQVGYGAMLSGTVVVTAVPSRTLTVEAGANGQGPSGHSGGSGGSPGGGGGAGGNNGGGGGGGWTGVTSGSTRVAVAGGGAGTGGYGSGATPAHGGSAGLNGAGGTGGTKGGGSCSGGGGGNGATQAGPGGGGGGGSCTLIPGSGGSGGGGSGNSAGNGGGGSGTSESGGGGGGGGGGWFGGGGGGGGSGSGAGTGSSGGGGGGGSSDVHAGWVRTVGYTCTSRSATCKNVTGSAKSTGWAYVSLSWTLQPTTTTLVVTGSSTPQAGQTVTLKATVAHSTAAVDQGAVTFSQSGGGAVTGCSTRPVATGIATCTLPAPGNATYPSLAHSYTATYEANLAYATSQSGTATFTTQPDATTIGQVSVTTATPVAPKLQVTVTPPSYATTGLTTAEVDFYWAATSTGSRTRACANTVTATPGKAVTASCRFTTAVLGTTYFLTATFLGQGENGAAGPSAVSTRHLTQSSPTVTLSSLSTTSPVFGQPVTVRASVTNLPKKDAIPGYVTFETAAGTPVDCIGSGQKNPLPGSNTGGSYGGTCTLVPGGNGSLRTERVVAAYSGDAQTKPVTSSGVTFSVTPGTATAALTITPASTPVGAPVPLRATVTDTHYPTAPIAGEVQFEEGGTVVCTAAAVATATANDGVATCGSVTAPTKLGTTLHFSASYCAAAGGTCADWNPSNVATATDTTGPDPTEVVLTPPGTQTNPATLAGGTSVTVTATVSVTAGNQPVAGTVTFEQNGSRIVPSGSGTCAAVPVTAGSATTGTASCTFVPVAANEDTVVATFTPVGTLLTGSKSAPWYVKVSGQSTTTAVSVPGPVAYGVPATATATVAVKVGGAPVPTGTVAFSVGGTPVALCSAQPVSAGGVATCTLPPSVLPAGTRVVGATFSYAGGTFKKSTGSADLTVTPAPTSTVMTIGPTGPTTDLLTVTVTDTAPGAAVAPTGTVQVTAGTTVACTSLAPSSGPAAVATCPVARPTAAATYSATYVPSGGSAANFTAGSPFTLTFTATRSCGGTSAFAKVWALAGRTLSLSVGGASGYGSVDLTVGAVSGTCVATGTIPFSGASLDLFGKTLASTAVSGYIQGQAAGSALVCLTGGTLGLPSSWSIGSVKLSATEKLCFAVTSVTGTAGTLGPPTGGLTVSGASLPFGFPSTSATYQLSLDFSTTPLSLTVHVAPATPPSGSPYATVTVTVTKSGTGFTATGKLEVDNLPFLGTPVGAAFTVSTGTSSAIAASVTLTIPSTATYSPVPGLTLEKLKLALSTSSGLAFGATALLGPSGNQVTVTLSGGYHAHKWSLALGATKRPAWSPITGITVSLTLSGQLTITTAGPSAVVAYDFQAGSLPKTGGSPLTTWTPGGGVTVTLDCVAFAFGLSPACGAGPTASSPTDPTLFTQGSVAFGATGGGSGITAGFMGSIDLKNAAVDLSYDATAGPVSATPVSGLTLTLTTLEVSRRGTALSVTGKATAVVGALGGGSFTVSFSDTAGTLVIAGLASFAGTHVPLTGLLVYASKTVRTFTTGISTIGKVNLAEGFSGYGLYHPTGSVLAVLRQVDLGLGTGAAVVFQAHWAPGGSPSFSVTLAAGKGFPFLSLPDTGKVTAATLAYASTALSLSIAGSIPVPGETPAAITLAVTVGTGSAAGTFSGTASVTTLVVFGQKVGLTGSLSRAATGKIAATIASCETKAGSCAKGPIPGPFTPFPGVPFQLSTVSFSLGTAGIAVAATMSVDGVGSLSVTGSLQKLQTWSLTVKAAAARSWSPVPGVTFSPSFTGTVADAAGTVTFSLVASGANGSLFTLSPGPATLSVASVGLGDAPPPAGCSVEKAGDLWLAVNGSLGLSLGSASGSVTAAGCFDLTAKSFSLSATITSLSFSALTGHVVLGAPTLTISGSSGSYQVAAGATLTVVMPTGGRLVVHATLQFESGGGFVIGAEVNLSQWLGSDGSFAYLYYASKRVTGFDTGDPTLQKIDLAQGITFAVAVTLPATVAKGLQKIGITLPAGSAFKAVGTATFSSNIYQLTVSVSLGSGVQLFTAGGAKLLLDSGFLQLTLAPSNVTFGLGLTATLDLPSPGAMGNPSHVALAGELSISDTGINVSLSLGHCGDPTTAWHTAFGAPTLTVQCASLTGGITYEFPFVDIGLSGTITSLPSVIATVTGYQQGAPISFAFNLDPFLLKLSIGTKNSTTPALEPLSFVGQGTLIKVYYASIYISPQGATIGSTVYPAGISMGFQATLFHVNVNILASIGLAPPSITFTATISKITLSGLSIGPVSVVLAASSSNFEFQFTGTASLGPGSANIGPDLKVGGDLSASVQVDLSTSKLSAFISGSVALTVAMWAAQTTCWTGPIPYGCNYGWRTTGFSATLGKTGFSVTGTGVTLEADGYSVTFDYNGHVAVSLASVERPGGGGRAGRAGRGARPAVPMALAASRQPITPTSTPVPPPSGPRLNGGRAVLLPSPTSATAPPTGAGPAGAGQIAGQSAGTGAGPGPVGPATGTAVGSWQSAPSMATARLFPASATLRNGDVLVAGGAGTSRQPLSSAEVYDPATKKWSPAGTLGTARAGATATVLQNGDVLVAGGYGATGQPLRSAELFDPSTGTFSATGALDGARAYASAELLPDGDVLVVGGVGAGHTPLATAELFDPRTGTFSMTGSLPTSRAFGAVASLPGGQVLMAGGEDATGPLATAERYDPSSGAWSPAGTMGETRFMDQAAVLPGGDVLVVGDAADGSVYDPKTSTWTRTQGMPAAVTMPLVAALPGGQVLVAGGESGGSSVGSAVLYQPASRSWQDAGSMPVAATGAATAVLSNGQVLVAGGGDVTIDPGGPPSVTTQTTAAIYSPPAGSGAEPGTRPTGTPLAVVSASSLPIALGSAGAVVVLAGLTFWAYESRRRRLRGLPPVGRRAPGPPDPGE